MRQFSLSPKAIHLSTYGSHKKNVFVFYDLVVVCIIYEMGSYVVSFVEYLWPNN